MSSSESYFYKVKFLFSPLWMCLLFFGQVSAIEDRINPSSIKPLISAKNSTLLLEGSGDYVSDDYYDDYNLTQTFKDYYSNYIDLEDHDNTSRIISGHNHGNKTDDETFSNVSINVTDSINGLQGMNGSEKLPYLTFDSNPSEATTLPTLVISTGFDIGRDESQNGPTGGTIDLSSLSSLIGGSGFVNGPLKGLNGSQLLPTIRFTSGPFSGKEGSREGETEKIILKKKETASENTTEGSSRTPSGLPATPSQPSTIAPASSVTSTQPLIISPVINLYPMLSPFAYPCSCTSPFSWANPYPSTNQYSLANPYQSTNQYSWANPYFSTSQSPWTSQCNFHKHMNQFPPQYPYPYSQTFPFLQTNEVTPPLKPQNTPDAVKQAPSVVNPGNYPAGTPPVERLSSFHVMPPIPLSYYSLPYDINTPKY